MSTQGKRKQDDALEGATQGSGSAKRRSSRKPARTKRSAAKQAASVADDADVPEALRAACIVHCERNAREGMEDHVLPCAVLETSGGGVATLHGVFDGHGGEGAARFCARNFRRLMRDGLREEPADADEVRRFRAALRTAMVQADAEYCSQHAPLLGMEGTTAVVACVTATHIIVAHAGDSRAILVSEDGSVKQLTQDHKPGREDEKARVEALGGFVLTEDGISRVQGIIATSRAIGDAPLKPYVTAEPDVEAYAIQPSDAFVLLASDGLWDDVKCEEAAKQLVARPATAAVDELAALAVKRGSLDNISVLVVDLKKRLAAAAQQPHAHGSTARGSRAAGEGTVESLDDAPGGEASTGAPCTQSRAGGVPARTFSLASGSPAQPAGSGAVAAAHALVTAARARRPKRSRSAAPEARRASASTAM